MAKGIFSQGVALLTDGSVTLDHLKRALLTQNVTIAKESPASESPWFSGASLVVPFRPEVNGYVAIDLVDQSWPDAMGDLKGDITLFGAWSMGHFGPYTFPGGLARAQQHAWAWPAARTVAGSHRGFIRLRISYVFGTARDAKVLPPDYSPAAELQFLSKLALPLLELPGVVCYFNPSGEVLCDSSYFRTTWEACQQQKKTPLPLWCNVRFFNLNPQFGFMDTVGNHQLDVEDIEAVFPLAAYEPGRVDYYLRNVTHYLMTTVRPLKSGESIDGPNETDLGWTIERLENGLASPPRRVLRVYPKVHQRAIQTALASAGK
jgi:hypothetical protein